MAITSGSFNSPGTPDKHVIPSRAQGTSATGDYSKTGATPSSGSDADAVAESIYGTPGDATRMNRREGQVQEALSETPNGISGADGEGQAWFDGSTLGDASRPAGVTNAASVPGTPGFPGGNDFPVDNDKLPPNPAVSAPKAVTAKSNVSNNPAVTGTPGFPGLP